VRTKRTITNLAYTLGSSLILLLLQLVARRLLVFNLGETVTAASTVIERLFTFFSIAELGVGSVISYRLYEQIAAENDELINKYMSLYKWAYRAVGLAIAAMAAVCAAALPFIIPSDDMATVYGIYVLYVISTLSSYFLVTRRLLYTCTQQGYRCVQTDLIFNVAALLLRIAVATFWPNYLLYFSVTIFCNVGANLVVAWRFKRDFPRVRDVRVGWQDFKELGLFKDLRHYLVHRLSDTVYGSSDTIVTSALGGETMVTNLGSYTVVSDNVTGIGNKIMGSFSAAIGNIVYDKNAGAGAHDREVFWGLDLFSYCFGSFVAAAYFTMFQPFVGLWMGEDRLLPMGFVLMFSLNEYVGWNHRMLGSYRAVLGHFEEDQYFMVASAVFNLLLSFVLFIPFGITGIVAATVVAHCIMWIGRVRVVCRHYLQGGGGRYLRVQLCHLATLGLILFVMRGIGGLLPGGFVGLVLRALAVAVLPNAINLAAYAWTSDAAYLRAQGAALLKKLKGARP